MVSKQDIFDESLKIFDLEKEIKDTENSLRLLRLRMEADLHERRLNIARYGIDNYDTMPDNFEIRFQSDKRWAELTLYFDNYPSNKEVIKINGRD